MGSVVSRSVSAMNVLLVIAVVFSSLIISESDRKLLQMAWEYKPVPRPPGFDTAPIPAPVPAPVPTVPSPYIRVPSFMPAVPAPTSNPTLPAPLPTPTPVVVEMATLPPYGSELKCDKPGMCANAIHRIDNPPNGFKMECGTKESCTNSKLTLYYAPEQHGRMVFRPDQYIDVIKVGEQALKGSTITIDNRMSSTVHIKLIECGGGFCEGATFVLWNAKIGEFKCDPAKGCGSGCMVVQNGAVTCNSMALGP